MREEERDPYAPITIACRHCGGKGADCWRCHGRGGRSEPYLSTAAIRRWVKIAHTLLDHPGSSASEIDALLGHAYGRNTIASVLGAMREHGIVDKDRKSPARWALSADGARWAALHCRACLGRLPRHKRGCAGPVAPLEPRPEPVALASLLGASLQAEPLELDALQAAACVRARAGAVHLDLSQSELTVTGALNLAAALTAAAQQAEPT